MTVSLADALMVLSTHDQPEALAYTNKHQAIVYTYDRWADGVLINAPLVDDAADERRENTCGGRDDPLDRCGA
jgi:hypothetical protein